MSPQLKKISLDKPISVSHGCVGVLAVDVSDISQVFTILSLVFPDYPFDEKLSRILLFKKALFVELKPGERVRVKGLWSQLGRFVLVVIVKNS